MIDNEVSDVQQTILRVIGEQSFSISIDEATTKSMHLKCVSVVLHFINTERNKIESAVLPLRQLNQSATASYLRQLAQESVTEYGLQTSRIIRIVTDGAANIRAAFL